MNLLDRGFQLFYPAMLSGISTLLWHDPNRSLQSAHLLFLRSVWLV
ncbi:hypothetical protein [Egbenema bharatensis]